MIYTISLTTIYGSKFTYKVKGLTEAKSLVRELLAQDADNIINVRSAI